MPRVTDHSSVRNDLITVAATLADVIKMQSDIVLMRVSINLAWQLLHIPQEN